MANAGTVIQTRRLAQSETTSSIVFYFSLICALAGLVTWPFGWVSPTGLEFAVLIGIGVLGGTGHIFLTESYRYASASMRGAVRLHLDDLGFDSGLRAVRRNADRHDRDRLADHRTAGLFVIWRERQLSAARKLEAPEPQPVGA